MNYDIAVVGAGVFGSWTAYTLRLQGASVVLVDAYGPGNSRASSGGESRMIRLGYGPDEIYSRSSQRSLELWKRLFEAIGQPGLFRQTGILWLAGEHDPYCEAVLTTLNTIGAKFEKLDHDALAARYPQLLSRPGTWGILEPESGVLMARRAVQAVADEARKIGVDFFEEAITPPRVSGGRLNSIQTTSGNEIVADRFIFACGPWLPKMFPERLAELIHVTRQEVYFFGVPPADETFKFGRFPAWIDFNDLVYGLPNLDGRGFKIAIDAHGPEFDPDTGERVVSAAGLKAVREYLSQRVPLLAKAPVSETRVCQYENTSNGDFVIDRLDGFENVWIVGGGSGHGFKHGPAVGEYVAGMISGDRIPEPRFSISDKRKVRLRQVY